LAGGGPPGLGGGRPPASANKEGEPLYSLGSRLNAARAHR
jgi:hypothetical protein